jgi:3-methyl-2-oxobutanoate hydroxymethyltransferase
MNKLQKLLLKKQQQTKIVCLTAYTYPVAKILDKHCDIILVGDSLAMTIYGMKDTVDATLDMMINHAKAVVKACKNALVVVDLPCGSYEKSKEQALTSAQKVLQETGCDAIKLETDLNIIETVKFLHCNNIPIMAHIGLLPQQVRKIGKYRYYGKQKEEAQLLYTTAQQLQQAGAFSIVIEAVPAILADNITKSLSIPTIGIGASINCDGQILVIDDLLGLNTDFSPLFVEKFADLTTQINVAVQNFANAVKNHDFPKKHHQI